MSFHDTYQQSEVMIVKEGAGIIFRRNMIFGDPANPPRHILVGGWSKTLSSEGFLKKNAFSLPLFLQKGTTVSSPWIRR